MKRGFTLIELVIAVAIVGALASIAIPTYLHLQLRSRRTEAGLAIDGIRVAEAAYQSEWDTFTAVEWLPASTPSGRIPTAFGATPGDNSDWDLLGWMPDHEVRGAYSVATVSQNDDALEVQDYTAYGLIDADADGINAQFLGKREIPSRMLTANNIY